MRFAKTYAALLATAGLAGCAGRGDRPTSICAGALTSEPKLCDLIVSPDPVGRGPAATITLTLVLSDLEDDLVSAVARLVPVTDATGTTGETGAGARSTLRYTLDLSGRVPNPPASQAGLRLDVHFVNLVNDATGTPEVPQAGFYRLELQGSDATGNASNVVVDTFEVRIGAPVGGSKIAFVSTRDADVNEEIFIMNADGSGVIQLTATAAGVINRRPAFSPDGGKIAFTSTRDGGSFGEIYIMNAADGSGLVRLTTTASTIDDSMPVFSPDGSTIAFVSNRDGNYEIYVMNVDGTNVTPLTDTVAGVINRRPVFSPDGARIAFASNRGGNYEIYVMNADGTGVIQLTTTAAPVDNRDPAFSPDGARIAFETDRNADEVYEIWIMSADGSGAVQLTTASSLAGDHWPAFSPDGGRIAFESDRDEVGNMEIYVIDAVPGSGVTRLTSNTGATLDDTNPTWR